MYNIKLISLELKFTQASSTTPFEHPRGLSFGVSISPENSKFSCGGLLTMVLQVQVIWSTGG